MKPSYYLCAYGHVIRHSGKVAGPAEAARECFGVVDRVTTLCAGTRKNLSGRRWTELRKELAALHKDQTGNIVTTC